MFYSPKLFLALRSLLTLKSFCWILAFNFLLNSIWRPNSSLLSSSHSICLAHCEKKPVGAFNHLPENLLIQIYQFIRYIFYFSCELPLYRNIAFYLIFDMQNNGKSKELTSKLTNVRETKKRCNYSSRWCLIFP